MKLIAFHNGNYGKVEDNCHFQTIAQELTSLHQPVPIEKNDEQFITILKPSRKKTFYGVFTAKTDKGLDAFIYEGESVKSLFEMIVLLRDHPTYFMNIWEVYYDAFLATKKDVEEKPFDDHAGYTYIDILQSCTGNVLDGHSRIATEMAMTTDSFQLEFGSDLTLDEALRFYKKSETDFKRDVIDYYIAQKRELRKQRMHVGN